MNVVLIMVRENGQRRSFALTRDTTVIGRREDADFRIPLTDVSRKHCRLVKNGAALHVEDLGSSNGTVRNGERVKQCELEPGDTLQIGPIKFIVQIDGEPAESELPTLPKVPRTSSPAGSTPIAAPSKPPSFDSSTFDLAPDGSDSGLELEPPKKSSAQ